MSQHTARTACYGILLTMVCLLKNSPHSAAHLDNPIQGSLLPPVSTPLLLLWGWLQSVHPQLKLYLVLVKKNNSQMQSFWIPQIPTPNRPSQSATPQDICRKRWMKGPMDQRFLQRALKCWKPGWPWDPKIAPPRRPLGHPITYLLFWKTFIVAWLCARHRPRK